MLLEEESVINTAHLKLGETRLVMLGKIFITLGVVPLCFLIYTLFNLKKLEISLSHPRVIVEASLVIGFVVAGLIILS